MYSAEDRAAHMVANTSTQAAEIAYQVRRLSPHPSIAIWAGGNEIGGGALYSSFALEAVSSIYSLSYIRHSPSERRVQYIHCHALVICLRSGE